MSSFNAGDLGLIGSHVARIKGGKACTKRWRQMFLINFCLIRWVEQGILALLSYELQVLVGLGRQVGFDCYVISTCN